MLDTIELALITGCVRNTSLDERWKNMMIRSRYRRRDQRAARIVGAAVFLWLSLTTMAAGQKAAQTTSPGEANADVAVFDEVCDLVEEHFFDPGFNGVDWTAACREHRLLYLEAGTADERSDAINALLAELGTSHTHHFTPSQLAYYELMGILRPQLRTRRTVKRTINGRIFEVPGFFNEPSHASYLGIGIRTIQIDGSHFIQTLLAGSSVETSGLRVGDRVIAADGEPFHPIESFREKPGQWVELTIQQTADPTTRKVVRVFADAIDSTEAFIKDVRSSARIYTVGGLNLGYARVLAIARGAALGDLERLLHEGRLARIDGLVLDLRDGWGGSPHGYVDLFSADRPTEIWRGRDGAARHAHRKWRKPLVVLINNGSRSAKETIAYGLREYCGATLVGMRTAGAVVSGSGFLLSDDTLLVVAHIDLQIDGIRLEGLGVEPDIEVPMDVRYAGGEDPQLDIALITLSNQIAATQEAAEGEP